MTRARIHLWPWIAVVLAVLLIVSILTHGFQVERQPRLDPVTARRLHDAPEHWAQILRERDFWKRRALELEQELSEMLEREVTEEVPHGEDSTGP